MRTLIDLPEAQIEALTKIGRARKLSRAALIREAISSYLAAHRPQPDEAAFGLWGKNKEDGLAYQEKVRSEW